MAKDKDLSAYTVDFIASNESTKPANEQNEQQTIVEQKYSAQTRFGGTVYLTFDQLKEAVNRNVLMPNHATHYKNKFKF